MTIKPEDVRNHLAGQSDAGASAPREAALGPAAVEPAKKNEILESISASYFVLRRGLAILALAFPILLWLWAGPDNLQGSISAYYHYSAIGDPRYGAGTSRDILVGILCAAGAALYFYKGYAWQENVALNIAGICGVLLALFPMDWPPDPDAPRSFVSIVHSAVAVIFFLAIAYVCLFRSGDTLQLMADGARRRLLKRIYAVLGTLMILLPLTVALLHYLFPSPTGGSTLTFSIEVAGIYVFAAFWLVKSWEIARLEKQ